MYEFFVINSCKKDFKKLSRDVQLFIRRSIFPILLKNPFAGEKLKGQEFKNLHKFGIRFRSVDYRIVYKIKNKELIIIFIMIASRENFYKKLKQRA
ncbi:MAG: type II toxin-antitoxin system RelE/ParE family toxin [Patescibacteria group bacterium]|nr:type II toxin-antitoxin system RelE/ParE family toxin [Patescibacteria group bacterium]